MDLGLSCLTTIRDPPPEKPKNRSPPGDLASGLLCIRRNFGPGTLQNDPQKRPNWSLSKTTLGPWKTVVFVETPFFVIFTKMFNLDKIISQNFVKIWWFLGVWHFKVKSPPKRTFLTMRAHCAWFLMSQHHIIGFWWFLVPPKTTLNPYTPEFWWFLAVFGGFWWFLVNLN